ncbi:MAG: serine--tRNA ligase [Armatimonadetes bacterium]|nr:serine--tRNA ligase [Armatimonadota bacterium]
MLDRQLIRHDPEIVRAGALRKGIEAPIDQFQLADAAWRANTHELNERQAEMNRVSKSIGQLFSEGKKNEAATAREEAQNLKQQIQNLEEKGRELESELRAIELAFPNLPHESVPDGSEPEENVVIREWGEKPCFDERPVPHFEIAEELKLIDFDRASKVSGSGFAIYTGLGAKLVRSLYCWMLDFNVRESGYTEVLPPFLVHTDSMIGTGNLPKFKDELYKATDDLWLIPTGEVPVTNMYRDEVFDGADLPVKHCAYTACFRRESGAAGRLTRGILRMHQFDKVELVKFVLPETSYDALERLVADAEKLLQALGLHYHVLLLCAGDMGEKSTKCYDLELWSPGEDRFLEISSCANFEAFQARRANIRFRRGQGEKPEFVHILNGSALAVPRLMVAILETNQLASGDVVIPEPLRPYMGTDVIEKP